MKYISNIVIIVFLLFSTNVKIQAQGNYILTFDEYLNNVKSSNINFLVEKYNIDIANANIKAAKVFPDPSLSLEGANNQEQTLKMGYSFGAGLEYNLELGGKRKARIGLVQSEAELAEYLVEDYFRNLRADATLAYLFALKQKQLFDIQKSSYQQMLELAHADSIRFKLGSITEIDAKQSKLEANTMLNDVLNSKGELQNALIQLCLLQGDKQLMLPDSLTGELKFLKQEFDILSLITMARNNRADLQAALTSKEISHRNLKLAKANRAIDLGLNLGVTHNSKVRNEIAPAPAYTSISAGISIPLKFSNINKGEINAAKLEILQSEANYEATELRIQSEVMQAYNKYKIACQQVEQFNKGLLHDAKTIFQKKVYSYERGETSILEVLNAQRTYNDIQVNYNETLYDCAAALIELERACGGF